MGELREAAAEASAGEVGAASAAETGTPPAPKLIEAKVLARDEGLGQTEPPTEAA